MFFQDFIDTRMTDKVSYFSGILDKVVQFLAIAFEVMRVLVSV